MMRMSHCQRSSFSTQNGRTGHLHGAREPERGFPVFEKHTYMEGEPNHVGEFGFSPRFGGKKTGQLTCSVTKKKTSNVSKI